MTDKPILEFWFDFASTYSYMSAMRIDDVARRAGVEVRWTAFLLGPIFKNQGWNTSPFEIYSAKGAYMWRDVERQCARYDLQFIRPKAFPQNSLLAARVATAARREPWLGKYCCGIFKREFASGHDIALPETSMDALSACGVDPKVWIAMAGKQAVKDAVRARVDDAVAKGIFGAPSFVTGDGELFWGDDRLEHAVDWAAAE